MSIESELSLSSRRTEPAAEIKPIKDNPERESFDGETEKDFLKRLLDAIDKLNRRDDLQECCFVIERHEAVGVMVVLYNDQGNMIVGLTPERCFELAEKPASEGLLVEIQC